MHWIALEEDRLVTAAMAAKHKSYLCPACASIVRVRGGPHRQMHFYHIKTSPHCAQHKKSEEHLRLQLQLASVIPFQEAVMEKKFPHIHRIADVAWENRKIVFEIQCSPITLEEVQQRCLNYRSIGWEIVWILSDKRFNRKKLSAAEAFLRCSTSYFAQVNGLLYDQCEIIQGFHRTRKGPPLAINPVQIIPHDAKRSPSFPLPLFLQRRWASWALRAPGDLLTRASETKDVIGINKWIELENATPIYTGAHLCWRALLKKCYLHIFDKLLRFFARKMQ